ncbi:MAG: porin [Gammaproteobacteria bacterium]|nr:porin [Gammaproteobacteria bacterium]
MNKKLIAMAVAAGLSAPLAASAEPTVYGHLQVEVASIDDGGTKKANEDTGTPGSSYMGTDDNKRGRLGVKGSEDLGNGMSAIYNFEWQVETTQGNPNDGSRVGMVGLKGGFGTVEAGALKQPYKYTGGVKYDPFVTTYMEARSRGGMSGKTTDRGHSTSGSFGHHGFFTDALAYKNKFGPISVWVATSFDEKGGAKGRDGDMNLSVKYDGGNFEAFYAMAVDDHTTGTTDLGLGAAGDNDKYSGEYSASKFGGMFKMGSLKLKLQLETTEQKYNKTQTDGAGAFTATTGFYSKAWESDVMFIGAEFKMGKNVFVAQLGERESSADTFKSTTEYLAIGAIHKFSKKTRAFVGHSTTSDSNNTPGSKTVDGSVTSVGLRVDF